MSETVQYLSDYLKELDSYMKRLDRDGLSRKDQQLFFELSNEYYDIFQKTKDFPTEILRGMSEFSDNIMNQSGERKELAKGYQANIVKSANVYIDASRQNELQIGIFRADAEILRLQSEKIQMMQELVNLDIKLYGQITEQTQEILEVQNCEVLSGRVRELGQWEQNNQPIDVAANRERQDEPKAMQRVRLHFPYMTRDTFMAVKDAIKGMGAKFDPVKKEWYVEKGAGQDVIDDINNYLAKYDEAIYLKLPFTKEAQKFERILEEIKQNGARYNPIKRRWYITEAMDRSKFFAYLPTKENYSVHEKLSGYKADAEKFMNNYEMGSRRQELPERA